MSRSIPGKAPGWRRGRRGLRAGGCGRGGMYSPRLPRSAHGFGQRYDLPLPLSLYLVGTAAAVVFSFVVVGLFVRDAPREPRGYPHIDLLRYRLGRLIASPGLAFALKLVALALFVVTVTAGFLGNQNPYRNIAPTLVWIIAWVGLAYVSAFLGNLWALINPWRTIVRSGRNALSRRRRRGRDLSLRLPYPGGARRLAGIRLLLAFSWIELVYPEPRGAIAHRLAGGRLFRARPGSACSLFGARPGFKHGEIFTVVFGTVRPLCSDRSERSSPHTRELALRPFGAGCSTAGRPRPR